MQLLKFRIKQDLHMTVSKRTFEAGIHGPFSPRTAWSDFCLSGSARSFKFCVVPGPNWPDISYFSVVDLDSTNRFWSVDPQSRTSMIMIIFTVYLTYLLLLYSHLINYRSTNQTQAQNSGTKFGKTYFSFQNSKIFLG